MSTFDISPGDTSYVDIGKGHYDIILAPGLYNTTSSLVCNGGFSPNTCLIEDLMANHLSEPMTWALQRMNVLDIFRKDATYVYSGQSQYKAILTPGLYDSNIIQPACNGEFSPNPCLIEHVTLNQVPEPMTWALLGIELMAMLLVMRWLTKGHPGGRKSI